MTDHSTITLVAAKRILPVLSGIVALSMISCIKQPDEPQKEEVLLAKMPHLVQNESTAQLMVSNEPFLSWEAVVPTIRIGIPEERLSFRPGNENSISEDQALW